MAAVPTIWLTVTTPVPPMPDIRIVQSPAAGGEGAGRLDGGLGSVDFLASALPDATVTVMNAGQSPFMHEKSKLHEP